MIEAVGRSGDILATTVTKADGTYSLSVNTQTELRIQAKAQHYPGEGLGHRSAYLIRSRALWIERGLGGVYLWAQ